MASETKETKNGISRLLYWEVFNFMTLTHARFDFDDRNIVSLVGYNDSGKSNALRALDVLMYNRWSQSQLAFIQTGKDYFRVVAGFSDGVILLKDKYINGQGLFEMWKDGECVYTTKINGKLGRATELPLCFSNYLNLLVSDDIYINSRCSYDRQFLVQTTGKENYAALNTVLQCEELSLAGDLLNADRNKLSTDMAIADVRLGVARTTYKETCWITKSLVDSLKRHDELLDVYTEQSSSLGVANEISEKIKLIPDIPTLNEVDISKLTLLDSVIACVTSLNGVVVAPKLTEIDTTRLDLLANLIVSAKGLREVPSIPLIPTLDISRLSALALVKSSTVALSDNSIEADDLQSQLSSLNAESEDISKRIKGFGVATVKCKNCGSLVELEGIQ